jgi:hypothetical protein
VEDEIRARPQLRMDRLLFWRMFRMADLRFSYPLMAGHYRQHLHTVFGRLPFGIEDQIPFLTGFCGRSFSIDDH